MDYKKIYQMFILGTGNLDEALKNGLGGVIFFSDDIPSIEHFEELKNQIISKSTTPLFLSIDEEGGRVERTEHIHPKRLSAKFTYQKGNEYLIAQTKDIATELNQLGFNLNFAPVVDVNTNPNNPIIGERAFSNNPEDVIKAAKLVSGIYKQQGVIPCIKHYPGHGDADADSHKTLPVINLPMEIMEKYHIKPFKECIKMGIDMIMVAHLHCTCFDKETIPTSLSHNAISYLKNRLCYKGVIISDDMVMKGIQYSPKEACIKGINAGLDMFIYRNADDTSLSAIEGVIKHAEKHIEFRDRIEKSYTKIINLKKKYKIL